MVASAIMLQDIIILTGAREYRALSQHLAKLNGQVTIQHADTHDDLERLSEQAGHQARVIAFTTGVIIKRDLLNAFKKSAYNFHPGPPNYPGRYPEAWGVYRQARWFGATAHKMEALVDAGPIIGVEWFEVPAGVDRYDMAKQCYAAVFRLFNALAPQLAVAGDDLPVLKDQQWSGHKTTLAEYEELRDNPPDDDEAERKLRFQSFGPPNEV
ncbi:MAG: methionyl-tRNA formyltransferase, partial [Pseudomonadota bacterium]